MKLTIIYTHDPAYPASVSHFAQTWIGEQHLIACGPDFDAARTELLSRLSATVDKRESEEVEIPGRSE